jgi:hypothetical protein
MKKMARAFVLGVAAFLCTTPSSQPAATPVDAVATYHPEVRLRKLHLVRPDLIHYPLSVEVIC